MLTGVCCLFCSWHECVKYGVLGFSQISAFTPTGLTHDDDIVLFFLC